MAINFMGATGLTGGTTGTLDSIDGASVNDGDTAFVSTSVGMMFYSLDDDSGAAESSPDIISPDSNAGDKRWILRDILVSSLLFDSSGDANISGGSDTLTIQTGGANDYIFSNADLKLVGKTLYTDIDSDTGITSATGDDKLDIYVNGAKDFEITANQFKASSGSILVSEVFKCLEKSADPTQPSEGEAVIWMSDGTGKGDDGDVMIASTAGGSTKYGTLFDASAGSAW